MKRILPLLLLVVFLAACSTEGDLKVVNGTAHNIYFNIDGDEYMVTGATEGENSKTVSLDTGDKFLFFGSGEEKYDLHLEGETFMMQSASVQGVGTGEYFTDTSIEVEANETYKIYCDPATHAGLKVINNSGKDIIGLFYYTSNDTTLRTLTGSIENGAEFWSRLAFATPENDFYYTFKVRYDDYTEEFFGSPDETTLGLDEQYVIEIFEE
jgi:hypothetical protein